MSRIPPAKQESHPPDRFFVNRSFDDFEEFSDGARDWQMDTALLDRSGFKARLVQVIDLVGGFHIVRATMDARIRQTCAPPAGLRTLCIPAESGLRMDWRGQQLDGNCVGIVPEAGELAGVIQPGFDMFLLSVPGSLLTRKIQLAIGPDADEKDLGSEVFHCDPDTMNGLRRRLTSYTDRMASGRTDLRTVGHFEDIAADVVKAVVASSGSRRTAGRPRRQFAARQAAAYLEQHAHEAPTVGDLCRLTGVSDRSLESGFKEIFGVSPKSFICALRLNGFRNALKAAAPRGTLIADVANDWGFWHMGQLATDYRRMFGELPSTTLAAF